MKGASLFKIYVKNRPGGLRYLGVELAKKSSEAKAQGAAKHLGDVHRTEEIYAYAVVNPEDYGRCECCGYLDPVRGARCPICA